MNTKEAYKQKIGAELKLIQAKLEVLKAKAKTTTSDMRIGYDKEIETLKKNYSILQLKLHKLSEVGEAAWEHLKKDIESSWDSLRTYTKKIPNNISEIKKDIK